ncbi:sulfatase-like hydrolase/transferase [Stenotrophomonas sp. 2MCAF14_2]|uniref:sulfatase-like hydrolase/transferase n=1 Tax=Stenotrophomonas sp. 2MCAF14_2 TaxID=3232983 RepID=UPI003F9DFE15
MPRAGRCRACWLTNTYDNTLVYTDRLLGKAIDLLQTYSEQRDVALIYVSDHGESLGERGLHLHGTPYFIAPREQTQVPMVMWFSPGFATHARLDLAACAMLRAPDPTATTISSTPCWDCSLSAAVSTSRDWMCSRAAAFPSVLAGHSVSASRSTSMGNAA